MRLRYLLSILTFFYFNSYSQTTAPKVTYPEVDKPMPNFELEDLQNFPKAKVKLSDFKGKWLVLDWWTRYCISCVESFPKMDKLQNKLKDKVQVIMVGYNGSWLYQGKLQQTNKAVREIWERSKNVNNLSIPVAFDSLLYQKYNLGTTPYIVIVDPNGIVRSITYSLTDTDMNDLITGKEVKLRKAYRSDEEKPKYDNSVPFLTYGNGGNDTSFLYRSLLSKWAPEMPSNLRRTIFHPSFKGRFEVLGVQLSDLYKYAFVGQSFWDYEDTLYGKIYPQIQYKTKDKQLSQLNSEIDKYCYSLTVPENKASTKLLMQIMQSDLKNYFGYDVTVKARRMPYWALVASEKAKIKLKTKGDSLFYSGNHSKYSAKNVPIQSLIGLLASYGREQGPPFIDETGINSNIDITINALFTDINDIKRALNEQGLDILKKEKEMKVIVISDTKLDYSKLLDE